MVTLDTNVAVYAFYDASPKADVARSVLARVEFVSVQVLNEFANVTFRKRGRSSSDAAWGVARIRAAVPEVMNIGAGHNTEALRVADRYRLSFYDSLMIAVALSAGATTLYSEDMQHRLLIDKRLRIVDPFRAEDAA